MNGPEDIYGRLPEDQDTIRLLQLLPAGYISTEIQCTLSSARLSQGCDFDALSYAWGASFPRQRILIAGRPVYIGQNLYDCLLQLRRINQVGMLWVDALCIRQTDDREKAHQVYLMAKIFTVAQRVLVWLGNHTDCSSELFKFVNRLGPTFSSSFRTPASLINAKNKLFERPYWSRTWVIQELFMARHLIFLCGSSRGHL